MQGGTLGSYRVLGLLEEGSMGSVYVGEHVLLKRKAAIKVLKPELTANDEATKRFFNEARALTQITDPGVVQVFDFGHTSEGTAYIVMELLSGESLENRLLRYRKLDPLTAVRLGRLMAMALVSAHAKGIIHRDLKPGNVLIVGDPAVTGGERPKILDFGIAKLASNDAGVTTLEGVLMGTPLYMSPEQCAGEAVDHRSDIYSLGCVLYAMLSGRPPFDHESSAAVLRAHRREIAAPLKTQRKGIPEALDALVARCMAKLPHNRYQSMADAAEALRRTEAILERPVA